MLVAVFGELGLLPRVLGEQHALSSLPEVHDDRLASDHNLHVLQAVSVIDPKQ